MARNRQGNLWCGGIRQNTGWWHGCYVSIQHSDLKIRQHFCTTSMHLTDCFNYSPKQDNHVEIMKGKYSKRTLTLVKFYILWSQKQHLFLMRWQQTSIIVHIISSFTYCCAVQFLRAFILYKPPSTFYTKVIFKWISKHIFYPESTLIKVNRWCSQLFYYTLGPSSVYPPHCVESRVRLQSCHKHSDFYPFPGIWLYGYFK